MLEVRDVHKSFGSLEVLKGVGLRVSQGEIGRASCRERV